MEAYRFNVICNKQFEMETDQTDRQAKTQKNIYTCKNTQKKMGKKGSASLNQIFVRWPICYYSVLELTCLNTFTC